MKAAQSAPGSVFCPPGSGDHQPGYPLGVVGGPVVIGRAHGDLPGILKHSVAGGQLPVLGGGASSISTGCPSTRAVVLPGVRMMVTPR